MMNGSVGNNEEDNHKNEIFGQFVRDKCYCDVTNRDNSAVTSGYRKQTFINILNIFYINRKHILPRGLPVASGTGLDCRTSAGPTGQVGQSWAAYQVQEVPAPIAEVQVHTGPVLGTGCYFAEAIHLQIN